MTWGTRIRTGPLGRRGAATADAPSLNETAAQLSTKVVRTPLEQANGAGGGGGRSHVLWVMATILLIAAFPRVWHLMSAGFRGDEAVYAGQAGILSGDGDLSRYFVLTSRGNSNFLLYQELVAIVYFFFGVSDVAARLVSVAFSLATVVVTFEFARTLYDRRVAYAAALGVAFSGYSVMLGRIALLDSTLTFLFTLSLLAFAKWLKTGSRGWFLAFAAAVSLTMQAKVTGVLVLVIAGVYLLVSRELSKLKLRDFLLGALVFTVFMTPVFVQAIVNSDQFFQFLSDSSQRVTKAPWHYYLDKLGQFNGYPILFVWAFGIAVAIKARRAADRLMLVSVGVIAVFFQMYPLKAFNYLLPAIPILSILGARGLCALALRLYPPTSDRHLRNGKLRLITPRFAPVAAALTLFAVSVGPAVDAAHSDSYFGLREAAKWLQRNTPENAGVMTLSKGSAQYALSFYARRDAYPFGRFRIATVFPGPNVRSPTPDPSGAPSRDWIDYWPPRLIKGRQVSYLVYYTDEGDDPPEAPIVASEQQAAFRSFIETYGGKLVHTIRRDHEGRAWIYRITELLAQPRVSYRRQGDQVVVKGEGFRFNSRVKLYYHRVPRGSFKADANGLLTARFPFPYRVHPRYWLNAIDDAGNVASGTGLTRSGKMAVSSPTAQPAQGATLPAQAPEPTPAVSPEQRLQVTLKVPEQTPVGSALPVVVHVQKDRSRSSLVSRAPVSLVLRSLGGRVQTMRIQQRETNQLGDAYFNMAALELPGIYSLTASVQKGERRGEVRTRVKVRRR